MPDTQAAGWRGPGSTFWPKAALALLALLQLSLVFTRAINWDEYSYFREVAWFAQGTLERPLQTIHVRLFAWLPGLFTSSTDHVVAARVVMFCCELVTLTSLFLIARRFVDARIALFAPLVYLSAGLAFQHGTAFRVDALSASLACAALAVLANSKLNWLGIAAFGLLAGLAAMVTIKVVLYLPAFAGLGWWRASSAGWNRARVLRLAACPLAAIIGFAALYTWHASGLSAGQAADEASRRVIGNSAGYAFFLGVPQYWHFMLKAVATAPAFAVMIAILPFALVRGEQPRAVKIALLGLWLPITSLLFYTNTLAYFYAFILAPLAVSVVPLVGWVVGRYDMRLVALVFALLGSGIWLTEDRVMIDRQRQLEANVHEVFAQPVTYFDHNFMLGNWPKGNGFMTLWGLEHYRADGEPAYRQAMERETIPLLLANYPELEDMIRGEADGLLLAEDEAALRANYVEFSWPLWVAGKDYVNRTGAFADEFLVPGSYTVHGGPIMIDGISQADGAVVAITRGVHQIRLADVATPARLVWGDHLPQPRTPLEPGPLYVSF